uniref:SCAN domain-containing protein 3 n=1 Tax=Sipha flava TaxID=143950 RepID=A0A2S2Q2Q0_9HEMI
MDIPKWVLDPFSNTETTDSAKLEEELIEVTTNEELKLKFKEGYQVFWLQKQISLLYSGLWAVVQTFLIPLLSSYLVERGFSVVKNLLTKKRQRLKITNRGDLKMLLTKIEPNINHIHFIKIFFFI